MLILCILQCVKKLIDKSRKSVVLFEQIGGGMGNKTESTVELIKGPVI